MGLIENFRVAMRSVSANMLRALLTCLIIAVGIMALVGILSAIDALIYSVSSNFSTLGANTLTIERTSTLIRSSGGPRGPRKRSDPFTYDQATEFAERYDFPSEVSISFYGSGATVVKYGEKETTPNMNVLGATRNYLAAKSFDLEEGRNFSPNEVRDGADLAIIGADLVDDLFAGKAERAIDKEIIVGSRRFTVVGTLKSKGSSMNSRQDRTVLIPLQTAKRFYGSSRTNYEILIAVPDPTLIEAAIAEAIVTMRGVRKLRAGEDNDFEVENNSDLVSIIKENTVTIRSAALGIAIITLLGAAIGLMNIMLVSVTERTREIGVRKALGATRRNVLLQFLAEAVVICQLGGLLGIVLGVGVGNAVAYFVGGTFFMPWGWIMVALVVCTVVGLIAGIYPAMRAASLDPIESLRYE